jgi:uncharacterized protein
MSRKVLSAVCLITLLTVSVFITTGCGSQQAAVEEGPELVHLSLATTQTGGAGYIQGGNLAAVVNPKQTVFEVYPVASSGAMENVLLVDTGEATIGYTPDVQLQQGYLGEGDFEKPYDNLRRLFSCAISYGTFIVDADSDIYTLDDLRGKTVNIGTPAQTTRAFNNVLLEVLGLEPGVDFNYVELGTGDAFDALKDGHIDAALQGSTPQMGSLVELATTRNLRFLEMPDDVFEEFNAAVGGILFQGNLPGGIYPGIDNDTKTFIQTISYFTHKDLDEDVAYEFTKHFWENIDELKSVDAAFEGLSINEAVVPLAIPMHPGAEKYFKEQGLID